MNLYFFPFAPNPTRVRLYLAEKRLHAEQMGAAEDSHPPIEEVLVNLIEREHKTRAHLARHPLGKLPVLELSTGRFLTESAAIIEYLEERFPEPAFRGETPEERARHLELDRIADFGVLVSIARIVHATNSPIGLPKNEDVAQNGREALEAPLALLEARLGDARYLGGDRPTVADCTLQAALQFARFREIEVLGENPNLRRWDADFRGRPTCEGIVLA